MVPTSKYINYLQSLEKKLKTVWTNGERQRIQTKIALCEEAQFVTINGVNHHYLEHGPRDGIPVILIHGWDCSSYWFHLLSPVLAKFGFHSVAPDLRGHGLTDSDPNKNYSIPTLASDILALADHLKFPYFYLVSFSLGSAVALLVTKQAPNRVRGNVVMNFGIFDHKAWKEKVVPKTLDFLFSGMRLVKWWVPVYGWIRLSMCKRNIEIVDIEMGMSSLQLCDHCASLAMMEDLSTAERTDDISRAAETMESPMLVISGENDPVVPVAESLRLAEKAPHGSLHILERTGHLVLFERSKDINELIATRLLEIEKTELSSVKMMSV